MYLGIPSLENIPVSAERAVLNQFMLGLGPLCDKHGWDMRYEEALIIQNINTKIRVFAFLLSPREVEIWVGQDPRNNALERPNPPVCVLFYEGFFDSIESLILRAISSFHGVVVTEYLSMRRNGVSWSFKPCITQDKFVFRLTLLHTATTGIRILFLFPCKKC